jgi:TonB family protein
MWELPPIVDLPIATPVPMSTSAMPLAMKTPLLPPPVLTTLSFPSAQSQVTQAAKSSELQTGAFSAVQRSGSSGPGSLVTRSAGFSSVNMAASSPPTSFLAPGSAFPEAQAVRRAGPVSNSVASEPYTPVEILYKPRPTYTEPARAAQIEGDVVLEVVFTAGGLVLVKRTLSVLGYGLDEQASAAARAIRFRPATRNGRNVDSPATIHIHFELAN